MKFRKLLPILLVLGIALSMNLYIHHPVQTPSYSLEDLPPYDGQPAVILNENQPDFLDRDKTSQSFERYSQLDYLGRCGAAYANVGLDTMPTEQREPINQVKPSGWQTARYDFVDGESLYNRCHLIAFQLTAENANELNLITGTRYFNVDGMLPYENQVADYVRKTGNHVLYRVTPIYDGDDLVAQGVEMEAWSVEDQGKGVCFHVFAYNVQPGVVIDYATGNNWLEGTTPEPENMMGSSHSNTGNTAGSTNIDDEAHYILNTSSKKFHLPTCSGAASIKEHNRQEYIGSRSSLLDQGYTPCGQCKP